MGAALMLALGISAGAGVAASAQPDFGNIDDDATGSITVHKHEVPDSDEPGEGGADGTGAVDGDPIEGVEFTLYHLDDVDLTDPDGWDGLEDMADSLTCPPSDATPVGTLTTPTSGQVTFGDLDVGAYIICETDTPEEVIAAADPFLVTIPMPFDDGWLYDVHAYPKNAVTGITKDVEAPSGFGLGAQVLWPVTVPVPTLEDAQSLTDFAVSDTFDDRLTDLGVATVTLGGADVDPALYSVDVTDQTVEVAFLSPDGLAFLEGNQGEDLVISFDTSVGDIGDGTIENEAILFVNDPDRDGGITSNDVNTKWGDARILKTDSAEPANGLEGAIFEVYEAEDPYAASCEDAVPTGEAIEVSNDTQFTSNATGVVHVDGLWVSDSNTGGNADQRCYVLVEVQAPAGFVTPSGTDAQFPLTVHAGQTSEATFDVEVSNVQERVPGLPITGSSGQLTMLIVGGLLLGTGVTVHLIRRRNAVRG